MFIFSRNLMVGRSRPARSYCFLAIFLLLLALIMGCGGGGSSTGNGGVIKIGWDPNTESELAGYRVHLGTRSDDAFTTSVDVGMATREGNLVVYTLTNLNMGQEYCIALTAYNTSNYESGLSNLWGDVCGSAR
jgi:Fibronectin type III domain